MGEGLSNKNRSGLRLKASVLNLVRNEVKAWSDVVIGCRRTPWMKIQQLAARPNSIKVTSLPAN